MRNPRTLRHVSNLVVTFALVFSGALVFGTLSPNEVFAAGQTSPDPDAIQVGYVIITPTSANAQGLVVYETFGAKTVTGDTFQAAVLPAEMTTAALLTVSTSAQFGRNLGVAIANPSSSNARLTLKLRREDGSIAGGTVMLLAARAQISQFVTELLFMNQEIQGEFLGTLEVTSDVPVAMVGLRFRSTNFSTVPVTNLGVATDVPEREPGVGGHGAVILPQFAVGGGWASELAIANSSSVPLTVRVDLFGSHATRLVANLNGDSDTTFPSLTVAPGGIVTLTTLNAQGRSPF